MAKSLHYCIGGGPEGAGNSSIANTTEWRQMFGCAKRATLEANVEMIMRTAGTISHLQIKVHSNTISGGTTNIKVRKNGADTSCAVAVGASATGIFEDNTNTVSVAAGDKVCITMVPGAATGVMSFGFFAHCFTPTATNETVTKMAVIADYESTSAVDHSTASTSYYYAINGFLRLGSTTEPVHKTRQRLPGTFRNLAIRVRTNTRSTSTVIKFRKNGADGNQLITVAAGATGWFEDTTNIDSVELNDDVNYSVTTGTGINSFVVDSISSEYVNTSGYGQIACGSFDAAGDQLNINLNRNGGLAPFGTFTTAGITHTDIAWKAISGTEFQFSHIGFSITANTIDSDSFVKLRVNNADTAISATAPSNTIGSFVNATDQHQVSVNDLVNVRLTTGTGSGNMRFGTTSIYVNDLTTVTAAVHAECDVSDMATDGEFTVNFTVADDVPRHTVWLALSA